MVGRHRRIRLRAEFRTWWCLASQSRAAASSLAAFAARRRVRVRRVVLAAFTRVVRDARWVVSANRRADRCARRSTWRRAVPRAFATWRLASRDATRVEDERDARVAAESALDAFRARVATRLAVSTTLRRAFRAWTSHRDVSGRARASIRISSADANEDDARRRRAEKTARTSPTLAFRATRLLAEDGADTRVSSDEAPRRRRARWKPRARRAPKK